MKVMQVMAGAYGGAEAFFELLVPALRDAGLDQKVVISHNAERTERFRANGIDPINLRFKGRFDLATRRTLKRVSTEWRPDAVLTWMNRATSRMPKGPHVHCARFGNYFRLKYYRNCDHLIGNTPNIVDYLVSEGWPAERAHYLPNFVDETPAEPPNREIFDTPPDAILCVAAGRLEPYKAYGLLVDAMAEAPRAHLWIAGRGSEREALEARAASTGVADRVRFLGWRDDIPTLMAAADIFVHPAHHEPLGNVLLEAWAQGTPVIATASPGPRMLIKDGETGLLTPVGDAATLGKAIAELATDPGRRRQLGEAGRAALMRDYSREAVVGRYLDFFERVTGLL